MILPTIHLPVEKTLLGAGAVVLEELRGPMTVTQLWDRLRGDPTIGTYERFVLALDLLFVLGAIRLAHGTIRRAQ